MPLIQQNLKDFPNEILAYIFSFLPTKALVQARLVNKKFKQLIDSHSFKPLLNLYFPYWDEETSALPQNSSFYTRFATLHQRYLGGLSSHVKRFFKAVLLNKEKKVQELLQHNSCLVTAECANHQTALCLARAYNRNKLCTLIYDAATPKDKSTLEIFYVQGKGRASSYVTYQQAKAMVEASIPSPKADLSGLEACIKDIHNQLEENLNSIKFDFFLS